jgi:hypothetical protein
MDSDDTHCGFLRWHHIVWQEDTNVWKAYTIYTFVYDYTWHYKPEGQDRNSVTAYAIWYAESIHVSQWISSSTKHSFQQIFFLFNE